MRPPLPNLVIAGVNKAGTTSLFHALTSRPDVAGSDVKETCYFLPIRYGEPQPPLSDYLSHFAHISDVPVVCEATPGYFYGGAALAHALDGTLPEVKVVVALREPVSRLLSFFRFQKSMLALPRPLTADQYVERCLSCDRDDLLHRRDMNPYFGVEGGHYQRYLGPWSEVFGSRLRVVFFEDLVSDPDRSLRNLGMWLDLDPAGWPEANLPQENRTIAPRRSILHRLALSANRSFERPLRRHPHLKSTMRNVYTRLNASETADDLTPGARLALSEHYRGPNGELASLLESMGITLPTWLDPNACR